MSKVLTFAAGIVLGLSLVTAVEAKADVPKNVYADARIIISAPVVYHNPYYRHRYYDDRYYWRHHHRYHNRYYWRNGHRYYRNW
jgi:hypothetical protein